MAFLSLNDDCLLNILSYLDDPWSFYSFSLACRRFYDVSLKSSRYTEHLKSKIKYYALKFYCEYEHELKDQSHHCNERYIKHLVRVAETYKLIQPTQDNILKVWQLKGPVAAEIVTWIKDINFHVGTYIAYGGVHSTDGVIIVERHKVTLFLPKHEQKLDFEFKFLAPSCSEPVGLVGAEVIFRGRKRDTYKSFYLNSFNSSYFYSLNENWDPHQKKQEGEQVTQEILRLFQDELGKTSPPLTDEIFHWFFFNGNTLQIASEENESKKIIFANSCRNQEPSAVSDEQACSKSSKRPFFLRWMKRDSKSTPTENRMEKVTNSQNLHKAVEGYKLLQLKLNEPGDVVISCDTESLKTENDEIQQYASLKKCLGITSDFWSDEAIMELAFRISSHTKYHMREPKEYHISIRLQNNTFLKYKGTAGEFLKGECLLEFFLPDGSMSVLNLSKDLSLKCDSCALCGFGFPKETKKFTPVTLVLESFLDRMELQRNPCSQKDKKNKPENYLHLLDKAFFGFFTKEFSSFHFLICVLGD